MEKYQKMHLGEHENIAKRQIFIDGISRCGKSVFSRILPSLDKVEHIQFFEFLEYMVPGLSLGLLDEGYAKAMVRMNMNMQAYNIRIGRNVNFRPSDQTGVDNHATPQLYYDRLKREEGDDIVEELRSSERAMVFQTHDLMTNLDHLDTLDIDYYMVALLRHPVDNIYSWWTRGLGSRFGVDPRVFTMTIKHEGQQLPYYCAGYEAEWLGMNPMERCIRTAVDLIEKSIKQYKKRAQPNRIHIVTFEDFTQYPERELTKICGFIGSRETSATAGALKGAGFPRVLDPKNRKRKLAEFRSNVAPALLDRLHALSERYEKNLYGIRLS